MLVLHQQYKRAEIHNRFGGNRQSGISVSKDHPYIFLFTGQSGELYGYRDGWNEDGVFLYSGEGQEGDMRFTRGNAAVRDHVSLGKDLLLFQSNGKGKPATYLGTFICQSWSEFQAHDRTGNSRTAFQFHLVPASDGYSQPMKTEGGIRLETEPNSSLAELRLRAEEAAKPKLSISTRNAFLSYRQRSNAVRAYALARSGGRCEFCGCDAPFLNSQGQPFLEVHHIQRISDDGPDDPRHVAAICPNDHRRIHFGDDGDEVNLALQEIITAKEKKLD